MDVQELRRLRPELDLFLERYATLFGRDEAQDHANEERAYRLVGEIGL